MKTERINRFSLKNIQAIISHNGALFALLIMIIVASQMFDEFLSVYNVTNVLRQNTMMGLIALGMTLVILTGGIDLSVGSIVALAAVLTAKYSNEYGVLVAIFVPILVAFLVGWLNGVLITVLNIVPFIATLATTMAVRGFVLIYTNELSIPVNSEMTTLATLGRGYIGDVLPYPVLIFAIASIILFTISRRTTFGRSIFAIGGNAHAANMMGLKVRLNTAWCYAITGLLTGMSGVILAGRLAAGQPTSGIGWEMDIIASVAIGGTLLTGGVGGIDKTIYGVLIIGLIKNMINLQGDISSYWQRIIMGGILLFVIVLQNKSKNH